VALDVDAVALRQRRWWRHGVQGADPVARRRPPPDGRWQRGATVEALYLASDEATVWAEWYRHLAEAGIPPNQQMPRALWTWTVDPGVEVADLTSAEQLTRVGLEAPRPGRSTWPPYQDVGETLWREGWPGLLAPSAARPRDGLVLCLFRRGAEGRVPARPLPPSRLVRQPPAPPSGMTT
jgi:RES domain-containing protein